MKGIVITEDNRNMVYGRLKKFFENHSVASWHNFNGGMRKRVKPYHGIVTFYWNPKIELDYDNFLKEHIIHFYLGYKHSDYVKDGDEIQFLGNRIVIKQLWMGGIYEDKKYIYSCYQIDDKGKFYRRRYGYKKDN